jgi:ABC-type transport system involved in multi-copper enzyme maturation permease subunit
MFANVLRLESDKLFRRWLLWIGLIITLIPGIAFLLISFNVGRGTIPTQILIWPGGIVTMLGFANGYGAGFGYAVYLLAVVMGTVTAQEYSWRTMQVWLSRGVSRSLLLSTKFLLALFATLLISLVFLLVGSVISIILAYQLHGGVNINQVDVVQALLSALRTAYGMLPYVALTLLLVVVTRSLVAIGGVMVFMLGIELPLSFILPAFGKNFAVIVQYLPSGLAQTMNAQNYTAAKLTAQTFGGAGQTDPLIAVICIALYTLVLFGISLWIFQKQDLTN